MQRPLWYGNKWVKAKGIVEDIEGKHSMENKEVQDKILEILREKNDAK